ncbi:MAG: sulfite exporter TauE/SafE family protein, partial [Chloroflexi bacterium]|nr:sulfite exporter TauE/SafE family protein [Chloroflexota bacterium]
MVAESLFVALITGLLSSLGHCIGMCGSIVAAYTLSRQAPDNASIARRLRPHFVLNVGRLITYGILGAAMGVAGSLLDLMGDVAGWQGLLSIVAGLVMLYIGLRLAGLLPSGEVAPTILYRTFNVSQWLARLLNSQGRWSNLGIGLL